jgi:hypothetical protein
MKNGANVFFVGFDLFESAFSMIQMLVDSTKN